MDAWLVNESDGFQEFRFTRVSYRAQLRTLVAATFSSNDIVVCYLPTIPSAAPSAAEAFSCPLAKSGCGEIGSPWPTLEVSKGELMSGQPKWYRRGTGYDDLAELQGAFYATSIWGTLFSNCSLSIYVEYEVELRGHVPTTLTFTGPKTAFPEKKTAPVVSATVNAQVPTGYIQGVDTSKLDPPVAEYFSGPPVPTKATVVPDGYVLVKKT